MENIPDKYKGYEYQIKWCAPSEEWKDKSGLFYIESEFKDAKYYETYVQAKAEIEKIINQYLESIPKNEDQWIEAVEDCVVQDGYEEWHISKEKALHVLGLATTHYKRGKP